MRLRAVCCLAFLVGVGVIAVTIHAKKTSPTTRVITKSKGACIDGLQDEHCGLRQLARGEPQSVAANDIYQMTLSGWRKTNKIPKGYDFFEVCCEGQVFYLQGNKLNKKLSAAKNHPVARRKLTSAKKLAPSRNFGLREKLTKKKKPLARKKTLRKDKTLKSRKLSKVKLTPENNGDPSKKILPTGKSIFHGNRNANRKPTSGEEPASRLLNKKPNPKNSLMREKNNLQKKPAQKKTLARVKKDKTKSGSKKSSLRRKPDTVKKSALKGKSGMGKKPPPRNKSIFMKKEYGKEKPEARRKKRKIILPKHETSSPQIESPAVENKTSDTEIGDLGSKTLISSKEKETNTEKMEISKEEGKISTPQPAISLNETKVTDEVQPSTVTPKIIPEETDNVTLEKKVSPRRKMRKLRLIGRKRRHKMGYRRLENTIRAFHKEFQKELKEEENDTFEEHFNQRRRNLHPENQNTSESNLTVLKAA